MLRTALLPRADLPRGAARGVAELEAGAGVLAGSSDDDHLPQPRTGRWQRLSSAHPLAVDSATTVLLALLTVPSLLHRDGGSQSAAWLLSLGLVLPLALRRRAPSAVFSVLALIALLQWAVDVRIGTDFVLLVALYTVAAHQTRRRALVAAGVLEVGVVLASVRFAPAGEDVLASMVFLSGLVAAALFIGITLRTRRAYLASVLDRAVRLERERDQQARLAATAERTRIAREMHDIIAHNLSVMVALADGAAVANERDPQQATGAMRQVSATGRQALSEMQRLLGVLREDQQPSERAPQPDLSQLDELLAHTRQAGLPARLMVTGTPVHLPPTREAAAYRIVQEALTNVLKHAIGASDVEVLLRWTDGALLLAVVDDGEAVLPVRGDGPPGHGLSGMAERVSLFGGSMSCGPQRSGGWAVRAELPFHDLDEQR